MKSKKLVVISLLIALLVILLAHCLACSNSKSKTTNKPLVGIKTTKPITSANTITLTFGDNIYIKSIVRVITIKGKVSDTFVWKDPNTPGLSDLLDVNVLNNDLSHQKDIKNRCLDIKPYYYENGSKVSYVVKLDGKYGSKDKIQLEVYGSNKNLQVFTCKFGKKRIRDFVLELSPQGKLSANVAFTGGVKK